MRTRDLQSLARYWQRKLRLAEWRILVRYAKKNELPDAYASTTWDSDTREALILVNRPTFCRKMAADAPAALFWIKDGDEDITESMIVHEMVHIVIDGHNPLPPSGKCCPHQEYAINRLTEALK